MNEAALVASAFSVIGSAVSTAKNAVELAKETSNRELKSAVNEVLDAVLDAKVKVHDLGDENRSLRQRIAELEAQLDVRAKVKRDPEFGYWFKQDETDPLCPKCYEGQSKVSYLSPLVGRTRTCRVCGWIIVEKQSQVRDFGGNPWG